MDHAITEEMVGSGADSGITVQQQEHAPALMQAQQQLKMKVMVALDDSDGSFYALDWALSNLLSPKTIPATANGSGGGGGGVTSTDEEGCMVYLVNVQHPFTNTYSASFAASSVAESVKKAQAEISAIILERALSMCKQKRVRAETMIIEGEPKEEICKAIEQTHVDMLVIGSRGLGGIKRAFLGSVSDYCTHHACCPVLIVKPPKNNV